MVPDQVVVVELRHGVVDLDLEAGPFQFTGDIGEPEVGPPARRFHHPAVVRRCDEHHSIRLFHLAPLSEAYLP